MYVLPAEECMAGKKLAIAPNGGVGDWNVTGATQEYLLPSSGTL